MLITYQYRLNPTPEQALTMEVWGELLCRHYNYALGQRLDWLRRTRCQIDRCSIVCEPIGDVPEKVDYYTQASELRQTKELFPEYKNILCRLPTAELNAVGQSLETLASPRQNR